MIAPVAGLVVGYAALTAVVSAGVGALVAGTPAALTALTLVGGGYLMWQGIGISALNPKALLLFLALLPQFTAPHGPWPLAAQIALLGSIFTATRVRPSTRYSALSRRPFCMRDRLPLAPSAACPGPSCSSSACSSSSSTSPGSRLSVAACRPARSPARASGTIL